MKEKRYEIERKYLVDAAGISLDSYPFDSIEQAYLHTEPVIRIRKCNSNFILTIKGKGIIKHQEYEMDLSEAQYLSLLKKKEGNLIKKKRYHIPYFWLEKEYHIELDVFELPFPMILAEVEFDSMEEADAFRAPGWFLEDVSGDEHYHNSYLSRLP